MRWLGQLWRLSGRWALLSAVLRERAVVIPLFGFAFVYLIASFFGVSLWACGLRVLTGLRCPGCGLTTGCKAFLRGQFAEGVAWNWLTPVVILALACVPVVLAMPPKQREKFLTWFERFEKRTRLVWLLLLVLLVQSLARGIGWA